VADYLFEPVEVFALEVKGDAKLYPLRRIFCVGRNYAAHAAEMGNEVDREAPWYFTKQVAHAVTSGAVLPYPPGTENYHHEMELAFVLGASVFCANAAEAQAAIYAYGCALDMTRRDRQQDGKTKQKCHTCHAGQRGPPSESCSGFGKGGRREQHPCSPKTDGERAHGRQPVTWRPVRDQNDNAHKYRCDTPSHDQQRQR